MTTPSDSITKKRPYFTLSVFLIVFFILGKLSGSSTLVGYFLFSPTKSLLIHPWEILTYGFIHIDSLHLISNLLFLSIIGWKYTSSPRAIWWIFFGGIIAGGMSYQSLYQILTLIKSSISTWPLVGASAGLMALLSFNLWGKWKNRKIRKIERYDFLLGFIILGISFLIGDAGSDAAHIGGCIFGGIFAYFYSPTPSATSNPPKEECELIQRLKQSGYQSLSENDKRELRHLNNQKE